MSCPTCHSRKKAEEFTIESTGSTYFTNYVKCAKCGQGYEAVYYENPRSGRIRLVRTSPADYVISGCRKRRVKSRYGMEYYDLRNGYDVSYRFSATGDEEALNECRQQLTRAGSPSGTLFHFADDGARLVAEVRI